VTVRLKFLLQIADRHIIWALHGNGKFLSCYHASRNIKSTHRQQSTVISHQSSVISQQPTVHSHQSTVNSQQSTVIPVLPELISPIQSINIFASTDRKFHRIRQALARLSNKNQQSQASESSRQTKHISVANLFSNKT
jgi:hypothetical protein